jgi:aldehyde:ferredoxin oxidoreductase
MAGGYTGKIARINLTKKEIRTIDTAQYEKFGGGFGIGAAIFWDLAAAPGASYITIDGRKPVYENGKWGWQPLTDMYMDEKGVEFFKTNFYKLEGWDINTGWPTQKTLEDLDLKKIADTLKSKGKLGA